MPFLRAVPPSGWYPKRGEVCLVALDKERPVILISSDVLNRHSLDVCVIPVSTAEHKAFSLRPSLPAGAGGLDRKSWAKCDQVMTIEKRRVVYPPLGSLDSGDMARVENAVRRALELP